MEREREREIKRERDGERNQEKGSGDKCDIVIIFSISTPYYLLFLCLNGFAELFIL